MRTIGSLGDAYLPTRVTILMNSRPVEGALKRRYVGELARRMLSVYPAAGIEFADPGQITITFNDPGHEQPVVLHASEAQLEKAISKLGQQSQDAWPNSTQEEAGFNILELHLEEVLATRRIQDVLSINADGLVWPR